MSKSRSQAAWYLLGGIFFILAGIFAWYGIVIPNAPIIALIIVGAAVIVMSVKGYAPTFPSLGVFLLGLIVFSVVCSGYTPSMITRSYELTSAQVDVKALNLECIVTTGNIRISFTSNETIVYKATFSQFYFPFFMQRVDIDFINVTKDKEVDINASATTANAEIIVGPGMKSRFYLTTTTGNIQIDVPSTEEVKEMKLKTTTGNVDVSLSNTASLESLKATATTGNVELSVNASYLAENCTVQVGTTTGNVKLDLLVGENVECDLAASTNLGNVRVNQQGFIVLNETERNYRAQTENYAQSVLRLNVTLSASTGNIRVNASIIS